MLRLVFGVVALSILALPVHAQRRGPGPTPEEIEKKREAADLDRQYKAALQQTQSQSSTQAATHKDPWANMRAPADNRSQ